MATRDYTLGKGKVLFKPSGGSAYVDLGNAPAFNISLTIDKLEHLSSRSGLSLKDLEVITKMGIGGSFTLDEPNAENLRMFVMATTAAASTQAAASLGAIDDVQLPVSSALGKWYPLGTSVTDTKTIGTPVAGDDNIGTAVMQLVVADDTITVGGTQTADAGYTWEVRVSTEGASTALGIQTRRQGEATWTTEQLVTEETPVNIKYDSTQNAGAGVNSGLTLTFQSGAGDVCSACKKGDSWTIPVTYVLSQTTRVYNIDAGDNTITVKNDGGTITYVEGIEGVGNYQVDRAAGLLYINLDQSTPTDAIADGDLLEIQVKKLDGTKSTSLGATKTTMKGDLYFVGAPPQGRIIDVMGFCSLTPNGDFSLIGTDWMQMQFNVEFLEVAGVSGLIKVEDRGKVDL